MGNKKPLYDIPISSTEFTCDAVLCGNVIRYGYSDGSVELRGGIVFQNVKAKRTRSEAACTAWHVEGVYDILSEIEESDWVEEIMTDTQDRQQRFAETWLLHHYIVYLDGTGCIEVLAESWSPLRDEPGSWT